MLNSRMTAAGVVLPALAAILLSFTGCSVQKLAVGATGGIIDNAIESLYEESDLELVEAAIPGQLKLLEGLIKSDPGNEKLLLNAVMGYTGYALGFVEDYDPERARLLYKKAADYGIRLLETDDGLKKGLAGSLEDLDAALRRTGTGDVPKLFWAANAWGSYINLSRADPDALFSFSKVTALMNCALELDESFYYGGAHLFFGLINAELGIAGGDMEKAKEHFLRADELADGKFLLTKVFYARYYAANDLEEELFTTTLQAVVDAPGDELPEVRMVNEIAKRKAALYLSKKDEWF